MSNRKNYNSIVFLTVYLGLVLVGASPQVLAQAALTSRFEIKNEIVVEDDLDEKPDDKDIDFSESLNYYFGDIENVIKDLQKYHQTKGINLDSDAFDFERYRSALCLPGGDRGGYISILRYIEHPQIERAIYFGDSSTFYDWDSFSDCRKVKTTSGDDFRDEYKIRVSYDIAQLSLELSVPKATQQKADFLAEKFNDAYRIYEIPEKDVIVKTIYQNTQIRAENKQVFIVTRLPRAAIDDLLAEKDAQ